ncbi:phosphoenolpyruvate synthase [Natrinema salsiterrestre]|uniref:Phosphoenolpyruvate synthase n=1 Tax=Natrinema salsiterrestre TaxID=2950540 RepID=A0A9Q4L0L2_9EURY|nr:phosphoenolpyruvate synthase [Natrinema salsiterrestre]MDF9745372.1 phosphoenolpyruvate synthase [Natrinema salsiterrestre]
MAVLWLDEISAGDLEKVGGKGASLGELTGAGLPVPPGFVVTAGTYRSFIEEAEIDEELFAAVDVDVDDSAALADAANRAQELIVETPFPDELREEILESYREVGDGEAFVAVRSSATAEDLPDASFAGQQETFLNVTEEDLLNRVRECWASLFTQRAIYYRQEQGFDHSAVNIAVVVQQMVDAEKSGVMFTSHPSTGDKTMIIEAAWGLGEAVVSGAVSPDNYVIDREDRSMDVTVAEKKVMHEKDEATGQTVEREVPEDKRTARVISDDEIDDLMDLGERVEDHYGDPQDVEWAIVGGDVYMLQSRPITTIDEDESDAADPTGSVDTATGLTDGSGSVQSADSAGGGSDSSGTGTGDVIVDGLGSSPGTVSGPAKIVTKLDDLAKVSEGDIIVTEMTMPDMVPAMKRASGIITDEGGMTSHAAIVSRELGVPAIVGTTNATTVLEDGQVVTLDGDKGAVLEGSTVDPEEETEPVEEVRPQSPVKPMTATEVKVNVSIPEAAERAAATGADGVGLLRTEHMILSLNQTPEKYIEENGTDAYTTELVEGIRGVADAFYPRPVRVRTLDAPTDEFRQLEGGDDEPAEHNPMLGYRGIRRSLDRQDVFAHELEAFRRLYELGYDNVEIMFPLVNDAEDIYRAKECMKQAGIDPEKRKWGAMIETPASALSVEGMAEAGIDFASFGTNDLTQYTLAVDRNNEHVADRFDELHPAVLRLIGDVIETCREHDVDTSICGQAGSKPEMVRFLVNEGISSISANIDAVRDVQHEVKRVEQKLLLDSVR